MGYTTEFNGQINIVPALNNEEIEYLKKFCRSRRMNRTKGPYFVDGSESFGQGRDADIINYNDPAEGQPGLWCQWVPTNYGNAIEWDGAEKFYCAAEWIKYIIEHFIGSEPKAKGELPFLQGHTLNGEIFAQGEEPDDRWKLIVRDNKVFIARGDISYLPEEEI